MADFVYECDACFSGAVCDTFGFISCGEKPAMSRRQVGSTRRNGSFPFAGAFNSKSKSSPLLSIGLVVVVIVLGFNVQFFVCEFDCNLIYLQWIAPILLCSNRDMMCCFWLKFAGSHTSYRLRLQGIRFG